MRERALLVDLESTCTIVVQLNIQSICELNEGVVTSACHVVSMRIVIGGILYGPSSSNRMH